MPNANFNATPYKRSDKMSATFSKPFMNMRMSHGTTKGFYKQKFKEKDPTERRQIHGSIEFDTMPPPIIEEETHRNRNRHISPSSHPAQGLKKTATCTLPVTSSVASRPYTPRELIPINSFKSGSKGVRNNSLKKSSLTILAK